MSGGVQDWASFWDQPHSIYVNARHFDVHYRDIAHGIIAQLPGPNARVLDYGCGEATHADLVAAAAAELILCEAAPSVRTSLSRRFADNRRIRVLSPEEVARLPDGSIDLLVASSPAGRFLIMPFVFAAIAPHGFPLIPELSDDADGALATRAAMDELGRRAAAAAGEALIIAGPHGVRVDGAICLADTARAACSRPSP